MQSYDDMMNRILEPFRRPVEKDTGKMREAIRRGEAAQRLQNDADLKQAFEVVEDVYMRAWRQSGLQDVERRERCHIAVNLLSDLKHYLMACVANGDQARTELEKIAGR